MKKRSIIFIITLILCAVMLPLSISAADDGADHVHAVNPETGECECCLSYPAGVKSGTM